MEMWPDVFHCGKWEGWDVWRVEYPTSLPDWPEDEYEKAEIDISVELRMNEGGIYRMQIMDKSQYVINSEFIRLKES